MADTVFDGDAAGWTLPAGSSLIFNAGDPVICAQSNPTSEEMVRRTGLTLSFMLVCAGFDAPALRSGPDLSWLTPEWLAENLTDTVERDSFERLAEALKSQLDTPFKDKTNG